MPPTETSRFTIKAIPRIRSHASRQLFLIALIAGQASLARAQVVLDGSLGGSGPIAKTGDTYSIPGDLGRLVGGGDSPSNLFYGFSQFEIADGETARFVPGEGFTASVANVIARIRSSEPTRIGGALVSEHEGASLFLINPRGVIFSSTARVDVPGAFHVTTADFIEYEGGGRFDVMADAPLLLVHPLVAYGFGGDGSGAVDLGGRFDLRSDDRPDPQWVGSFSAAGSTIQLESTAVIDASVDASTLAGLGTIQLAAVGSSATTVPIAMNEYSARASGLDEGASITMVGGATLQHRKGDAVDWGRVVIRGGRLEVATRLMENGTPTPMSIFAGGGDGATIGDRGVVLPAIDVEVSGELKLVAGTRWQAKSTSIGLPAGAGDIRIAAGMIEASGPEANANVLAYARGNDDGGDMRIEANRLRLSDGFRIRTQTFSTGDAGDVLVDADSVEFQGNSTIESVSRTAGGAGDISIFGSDVLSLRDTSQIRSLSYASGPGGEVDLRAGRIDILSGSEVSTTTDGSGSAGDVWIRDFDSLTIDGSGSGELTGIFARSGLDTATTRATGDGGDITLEGGSLFIRGGGQITTAAFNESAPASAGGISIVLGRELELDSGTLTTESNALGPAGPIWIQAPNVEIVAGSRISTKTTNRGNAGTIFIGGDDILISGEDTLIVSETVSGLDGGPAGRIEIEAARSVAISDGAGVIARSLGSGSTGEIEISSRGDLSVSGSAAILATGSTGDAPPGPVGDIILSAGADLTIQQASVNTAARRPESGDIRLSAGRLVHVSRSGSVTTNVDATGGQGGDVSVDGDFIVLDDATITANADQAYADAGNIRFRASNAYLSLGRTLVRARASQGVSGLILVEAPESEFLGDLAVVEGDLLTVADEVTRSCLATNSRAGSLQLLGDSAAMGPPDRLDGGAESLLERPDPVRRSR